MHNESRTHKSLKNIRYALFYYFINLLVSFFSRRIFIEYLGAELLGLNTTVTNLLQFLNLAELGIGAAISYVLYKPLAENDSGKINEIVSVQGYLYYRIASIVIIGACVLLCFFPFFFSKTSLPLWYAYSTFIILLCSSLASYYFNYKEIVLTADQKDYKITVNIKSVSVVKAILQILAVTYFNYGYIWWLLLELLATMLTVFMVNRVTKKEYPWLKTKRKDGKFLKSKYPVIFHKTKQLFFHKIAGFVLTQTSPLIIYAYTTLTLVAVYGNYMLIVTGITALLGALFNSINAGVGNLVAWGDKDHILCVFEELFSCRFLLAATACYGVYSLTPAFIHFWIGSEYLLDDISFFLIIAIMYIGLSRSITESFINAYGLYHDIWAPITEAVINISLSILLGYFWGLPGILAGVLISLILIVVLWKPFFLFTKGFRISVFRYVGMYLKHMVVFLGVWLFVVFFTKHIPINPEESYMDFIIYSLLTSGTFFLLLMTLLYMVSKGMRDFLRRIRKIYFPN